MRLQRAGMGTPGRAIEARLPGCNLFQTCSKGRFFVLSFSCGASGNVFIFYFAIKLNTLDRRLPILRNFRGSRAGTPI